MDRQFSSMAIVAFQGQASRLSVRHIGSTAAPTVTWAERREWGLELKLLSKCKLYWPRAPLSVDPLVTLQKHGDLSKAWRHLVRKITATLRLPCSFRGAQVSKASKVRCVLLAILYQSRTRTGLRG